MSHAPDNRNPGRAGARPWQRCFHQGHRGLGRPRPAPIREAEASATGGMVKMMWWPARPCHGADHGPRPNAKNLVEPEGEDD